MKTRSCSLMISMFLTLNASSLGCGGSSPVHIAWLANDPANHYDNAILAGIQEVTESSQSTVDPFFAGFDPDKQSTQCSQALGSGRYDALMIIAADPIKIESCVAQAHSAGVAVAAVDLPIGPDQTTVQPQVPGEVAACFIPASRFGDAIKAIVPEVCAGLAPCNVYYVAGLRSFPLDMYGLGAVRQATTANPSIRLVGDSEAFYTTETARHEVAAALAAHPEINVVIASGDQMALGAEQAATAVGVTLRIVGAGAGTAALAAVRASRWFATFNALPRTEGRLGTELLMNWLRDRNTPPMGKDPVAASGLPAWWNASTLAQHPNFVGEWQGP